MNASRRLREAAKNGDVDGLRAAIKEGADVNSFQEEDELIDEYEIALCALYLAASPYYGNSTECARVLIDTGADVDIADEDGVVLIYACYEDWSLAVVRLLLDAGANTNHQDSNGCSALYYASMKGRMDYVRLLLDFGADPNLANNDGLIPLMHAALYNHTETMRLLIEGGAQVNFLGQDGRTVLFSTESIKGMQLLFQHGADPRIRDDRGRTAIQYVWSHAATRPLFENWTPHQMLPPKWEPSAFPLYIDHCPGFRSAIKTTLLVMLRYRHIIHPNVGMQIIAYIANSHRREQLWPIEGFSMDEYMK